MKTKKEKKGAGKPALTDRQMRYGKLIRAWDWKTFPELLQMAERLRLKQGITRTEFIERAIAEQLKKAGEIPADCKAMLPRYYSDLEL